MVIIPFMSDGWAASAGGFPATQGKLLRFRGRNHRRDKTVCRRTIRLLLVFELNTAKCQACNWPVQRHVDCGR